MANIVNYQPEMYSLTRVMRNTGFRLICENYSNLAAFSWPAKALDLGCGTGSVTKVISYFQNFSEIIGLDLDPDMVQFANANNSDSRVKFYQGDACNFDSYPAENQFELVTAFSTIHWWADPQKGISNIFKSLKDGGYFLGIIWTGKDVIRKDIEKCVEMSPWIREKYGTVIF